MHTYQSTVTSRPVQDAELQIQSNERFSSPSEVMQFSQSKQMIEPQVNEDKRTPILSNLTRFLVMVQAEICLTKQLISEDAFGNTKNCNCDVLVLTFRKECPETPPAHIKYIFKPGTTWNQGRNLLLEVGKNRSETYLYYIYIDDDIKLTTKLDVNPWWTFLDFLKRVEPAVGIVDYPKNVNIGFKVRQRLGCGGDADSLDCINAPNFDSAFNAFHYQAVDHILPYPTQFDKISWWYSGWYSKVKCDVTFPGQTVMLSKVQIINPRHGPYPRRMPDDRHDWNQIMRAVEDRIPEKYRNSPLLKAWKERGYTNDENTATHCYSLPTPHMPIKPFSYLESR